ncbi:EAL domain-containing protein [Solicola gregarius]|uniref:EAL domain-containing protein n=1 Tax=Solicola gregarius TaxID=2908642 RepID=A0AA46TGQ7_9ACTN|nr:EAL domain-containing protein [Solicola gregarius]UYM05011.1 EAL domain-containing protein [Solicola gregarius]
MSPSLLLAAHVAVYAAIPMLFGVLRRPFRVIAFYLYIGLILLAGGLIGSVYVLPVAGGIPAGSILYAALLFSSVLLVILEHDARVVRNVIKVVIGVEAFKFVMFALATYSLRDDQVVNPFDTDPALFDESLMVTLLGGLLIVAELVILTIILELLKRRMSNPVLLASTYVAIFVALLCFDGVMLPFIALQSLADIGEFVQSGVRVKLVLGLSFGIPLVVFLVLFRRHLAAYRKASIPLHELLIGPREDLVRELERQRLAIRAGVEQYRHLVESSGDVVITSTVDGMITSWNHAAERLYGYTRDRAVGSPMELIAAPDQLDDLTEIMRAGSRGTTISGHETIHRRDDGTRVEVSLTVSPVIDHAGTTIGLSYIGRDIGERRRMERTLTYQARHDALTGLPNRVYLEDMIAELARTRVAPTPVAVLFVDIDRFKIVNDAAGHHVGDGLLIEAAARLRSGVGVGETVARFGGDEFALLCPGRDEEGATALATRLLDALTVPFEIAGHRFFVSASIGISVDTTPHADELLRRSDMAMYAAKDQGSGTWRVFDQTMDQRARWVLSLGNDLSDAIESDSLELHYQPVIDLGTGRIRSVEALTRWRHDRRGYVEPEEFVSVAEDTGLITPLDTWVIHRASRDGARLFASGTLPPNGHVAVNLSVQDIADPEFGAVLVEAVAEGAPDFGMDRLMIELTETVLMNDVERTAARLRELTALGVRIAIDDFGTGYSSLAYLRPFPTTTLKIDQTFVGGIASNASDLAIVRSVVELAHAIGLETVAEGVETTGQLELLREMGCDAGQGFLWGPAVAVDGLIAGFTPSGSLPSGL